MNDPYRSFSFSFSYRFCLLLLACHIDKKYYFLLRTLSVRSVLLSSHFMFPAPICDALRDLVPFVQLSCRLKPATLLKLTLFHGCFSRFLNCKWYQISQRTQYNFLPLLSITFTWPQFSVYYFASLGRRMFWVIHLVHTLNFPKN